MQACIDCAMLICNGDTPQEMTEDETDVYMAAIDKRWGDRQVHVCIGDERGFSMSGCDYCGSNLGGDMHELIDLND